MDNKYILLILLVGLVVIGGIIVLMGGFSFSFTTANISNVKMAKEVDDNSNPVKVAEKFSSDTSKIYVTGDLSNAPPETVIKAEWHYLENNTKIESYTLSTSGSKNFDFSLSKPYNGWPTGSYEVRLFLENKKVETVSFSVKEENKEEFSISNFVFCSEQPLGYMNYSKQPENTYSLGETVWIYFNVNNYEYNLHSDGSFEFWFESNLAIETPGGSTIQVAGFPTTIRDNAPATQNPDQFYLQHKFTTPTENLSPGQYTAKASLTDKIANETVTVSRDFVLSE